MRSLIDMVTEATPSHGADNIVPDTLYHGTSLQNYLDIRVSDTFEIDCHEQGNIGFSTSEDESVAIRFARMSGGTDQWCVVLTLNGIALAQRYDVTPYNDDDEYGSLGDHYEYEWVVTSPTGKITQALRYITDVRVIDNKGDPNHLLPWDEAAHGFDRRAAEDAAQQSEMDGIATLKQAYNVAQAQSALLKLARVQYPDRKDQELRDLIKKLDNDKLYKMLKLYLDRNT